MITIMINNNHYKFRDGFHIPKHRSLPSTQGVASPVTSLPDWLVPARIFIEIAVFPTRFCQSWEVTNQILNRIISDLRMMTFAWFLQHHHSQHSNPEPPCTQLQAASPVRRSTMAYFARLQRGNATQRMFHRRNLRPPTLPNSSLLHNSGSRDGRHWKLQLLDETLEIMQLHLGFHWYGQTAMWGDKSSTPQK